MNNIKYYFAYGANMDEETMLERCPFAYYEDVAVLESYKFLINERGVATVAPMHKFSVHGILWKITAEDEMLLDLYEGVHINCYHKEIVDVKLSNDKNTKALVYIDKIIKVGSPRKNYLENIIKNCKKHNMEQLYIGYISTFLNK